jgi:hypothetical protein
MLEAAVYVSMWEEEAARSVNKSLSQLKAEVNVILIKG